MNKPEYLHNDSLAGAVLAHSDEEIPDDDLDGEAELSNLVAARVVGPWQMVIKSAGVRSVRLEQWFSECAVWGHEALQSAVDIDPDRRGGTPVLKGTRFTVGQTLAELAESAGVPEVANRFDLDEDTIRELLFGLALLVERPCR